MNRFFIVIAIFTSLAVAQTRIAAVGNSITYGYSFSDRSTQPYPAVLQSLLGSSYSVSNFGVSGATMLKLGDNSYWTKNEYGNSKAFLPNIVIIELGTNDSKDYNWYMRPTEFPADYKSMINEFRALSSSPEIWICLAPFSNNEGWKIRDTTITKRINPDILQVALEKGTHVIDLHSTFTDHSLIMSDSVHPTVAGAAKLAEIIREHMLADTLSIHQATTTLSVPPAYGYQWYKEGAPISGATNQNLVISEVGNYMASVKISANTDSRIVTSVLNVTDLGATSGIAFSSAGNPSSSSNAVSNLKTQTQSQWVGLSGRSLRIQLNHNSQIALEIYDIQGHLLQRNSWQGYVGMNLYPVPGQSGLRILKVKTGGRTQTVLYRP